MTFMKSETSSNNSVSEHTQEVANNMAMIFADQVKKGLIPWYNVPKALRSIVQTLLDRGE